LASVPGRRQQTDQSRYRQRAGLHRAHCRVRPWGATDPRAAFRQTQRPRHLQLAICSTGVRRDGGSWLCSRTKSVV